MGECAGALFWSSYAAVYDLIFESPLTRAVADHIAEQFEPGARIVDLGCGTGLASQTLTRGGAQVHGVDASPAMIRRARDRGRVSTVQVADAAETGLRRASAGGVVCANILHVHPRPRSVIAEALRLVVRGGHIVWVTPTARLGLADLVRADRAAGRSVVATIRADALRRHVAAAARIARQPTLAPDRSRALLEHEIERCGLELTSETTIHGVQDVLVTALR